MTPFLLIILLLPAALCFVIPMRAKSQEQLEIYGSSILGAMLIPFVWSPGFDLQDSPKAALWFSVLLAHLTILLVAMFTREIDLRAEAQNWRRPRKPWIAIVGGVCALGLAPGVATISWAMLR